jgi:hypothetical protein
VGTDTGVELNDADSDVTYCARHPQVETALRCGRCGTLICPRCLVQSPVGSRCPDCANVRKNPMVDVSPVYMARGIGAAVAAGAVTGGIWGFISSGGGAGFFGFFIIFLAMAIGWCVGEAVSAATNRKRARSLQYVAAAGVVLAYAVHSVIAYQAFLPQYDLWGMIATIAAAYFAAQRVAGN